jgi:hypothetical protein
MIPPFCLLQMQLGNYYCQLIICSGYHIHGFAIQEAFLHIAVHYFTIESHTFFRSGE